MEAVGAAGAAHAGGLLADLVAEVPRLPGHAEAVAPHAGVPDRGDIAAAVRPDGSCGLAAAGEKRDEEKSGHCRCRCRARGHFDQVGWGKLVGLGQQRQLAADRE